MIKTVTGSPIQTEELGARIASVLKGREMIALFGDLGAGKTAFTRGLCAGLGIKDGVCSPTFAIVNAYSGKYPVYHFDMYRINNEDDLFATGYYDYIGSGVIIIEWSENIESELEPDCIRIRITKTDAEYDRIFEIEGLDDYADVIC
ncbi:MAG: tRNA (adenosine(37)-N6)-threonylcarbamoyltransferase complex ATPase subunit type 1 TsaE [Ruminococcus sp.]|uniref:tRNA (adenosine(37)-N6)-threonylcarbamoyltransferase complex ATPase subunit type 1 TsaE n=1 Tax=Ruminococcus sp. TaxID=41978 RepID=UPI0028731838|nr:tRNA (adenosine(37)-N6)-threonylcarbamoyltransferase complex ATPase subunit type 1 TsaE [Ruminococcus sp.]MBQ3284072.1 tRNA (adenosine(37)-N6)-threonylcarbamoyltransferase complex ATPase subunit type 1 TsaE [Ruminococcus sp.]